MKKILLFCLIILMLPWGLLFSKSATGDGTLGDAWQDIGQPKNLFGYHDGDAIIDPNNPQHIVVTSFYYAPKQSWDGGRTWTDIIFSPEINIRDNSLNTNVYLINSTWYLNGWGYIYKTQDFQTFTKVSEPMGGKTIDFFWTDGTKFFAGLRASISPDTPCFYRSLDGGKTWEDLSQPIRNAVSANMNTVLKGMGIDYMVVSQNRLFVEARGLYYVSDDWGETWKILNKTDQKGGILKSFSDRLLYWETNNVVEYDGFVRLYQSKDNGGTWELFSSIQLPWSPWHTEFTYSDKFFYIYGYAFSSLDYKLSKIGAMYSSDGKQWIPFNEGLSEDARVYLPDNWSVWGAPLTYPLLKIFNGQLYLFAATHMFKRSEPSDINLNTVIFQIGHKDYQANGQTIWMETAPIIKNDRTFLPVRYVAEPLGAIVDWEPIERKVIINLKNTLIELWINKSMARVNGKDTAIDPLNSAVVPYITSDRTMVPLRFIAESFGAAVEWEPINQIVTITLAQ